MATPDESAAFRRLATTMFRLFVAGLFVTAAGLVALGWWLFGWWGVAGGSVGHFCGEDDLPGRRGHGPSPRGHASTPGRE